MGGELASRVLHEYHAREIFEIDLVHDAGVGRNDGQVAKGGLSPSQEGVTCLGALEFEKSVHVEGLCAAEFVHLHGGIVPQFAGLESIDQLSIPSQLLHAPPLHAPSTHPAPPATSLR